jgi:6-phosphogluconolactonase
VRRTASNLSVLVSCCALLMVACVGAGKRDVPEAYHVYFGGGGTGGQDGIFFSTLDMGSGQLAEARLACAAQRAGIIAIHPRGTHLYSVGKPVGYRGRRSGSVCAYRIDAATGMLEFLNYEASEGQGPCYLSVDAEGRNVVVCHYRSGSSVVLPLAEDGSLESASSVQQHSGGSVHPRRQTSAHPHAIVFDPAGVRVLVPDLGLDQVLIYGFDPASGSLTPNDPPFAAVEAGGGPRHLAFHPSARFVYVNLELSSKVTAFSYQSASGVMSEIQTLTTLPSGFEGKNANAGICVTPDGRFLYVSNRGHNSIAVYAIDAKTGMLTSLESESTRGDVPQAIKIDPSGSYLLVADKRGGYVSVFKIDKNTGLLTFSGSRIEVPKASSIVFTSLRA